MPINKRTRIHLGLFLFLFFGLGILSNVSQIRPFNILSHVTFSMAIIIWMVESYQRIINRKLGRTIIWMGSFLLAWQIIRAAKYAYFIDEDVWIRYFWYLYYVPMTVVPLISFMASLQVGEVAKSKVRGHRMLYLPCMFFIILVLTNDYHQMVFRFMNGIEHWNDVYRYGPVYYVIVIWVFIMLSATLFALVRKSTLPAMQKYIWIPLIAPGISCIYLLFYPYPAPVLQLPEMFAFMIMGLWEGFLLIGLVPSSAGYHDYFESSDLAVLITDSEDDAVYTSKKAASFTQEQRQKKFLDGNLVINNHAISGGVAYWLEDYSQINQIKQELQDLNQRLAEEGDLLQAENKLREEWAQTAEKNRIYDNIENSVIPQTQQIYTLVEQAEKDPTRFAKNMAKASFLTVYIKRKANLALRAGESNTIPVHELLTSIRESADYLSRCGVTCVCTGTVEGSFPSEMVVEAYDLFQSVVEAAMPGLIGLIVRVTGQSNRFEVHFALEGASELPQRAIEDTTIRVQQEDDTVYLSKLFFRGEEGV